MLSVLSPANNNRMLNVVGQKANGYHLLQTVYQFIDLCDSIHFAPNQSPQVNVEIYAPNNHQNLLINPKHNLITQAASALKDYCYQHKNMNQHYLDQLGADIRLHKQIPVGAGLGGVSSNAASTLLALTSLWDLPLDIDDLLTIGAHLGADVPVFIRGQNCWAEGIGEELTPIILPETWFCIVYPNCEVSTQAIFQSKQLTRSNPRINLFDFKNGKEFNSLEAVTRQLYKPVDECFKFLEQYGVAKMSGSGSSCFVEIGESDQSAFSDINCLLKSDKQYHQWQVFLTKSLARSPIASDQFLIDSSGSNQAVNHLA